VLDKGGGTVAQQLECHQCGGELSYDPSVTQLKCPYCGSVNEITPLDTEIQELDYKAHLELGSMAQETEERLTITCAACGAQSTLEADVTSSDCPFCGTNLVLTTQSTKLLKPRSVLPFAIDRQQALGAFRSWLASRWFAPSQLKRLASSVKGLVGVYLPYWTYDCSTTSSYTGERGDDYSVAEPYTTTENGRSVSKTRQVTKTRWTKVSGTVSSNFDDELVLANEVLPGRYTDALEPWDLGELVPYRDEYLSGFRALSYTVDVKQGFAKAKQRIDAAIDTAVRQDIGGDHQRLDDISTRYDKITFKHLLLPVWTSAYRFGERTFNYVINGRTGEVQGQRPYSKLKIAAAIILGICVLAGAVWLLS